MSTLRINNIEAQSVPASPTIDEKVKVTNSSGDILVNIDGKTSGITTIGINTTDGNIKFDANSNVLITGILTATTLAGNFTPDSLEVGSNIKLGNAGVITATNFKSGVTNVHNLGVTLTGGQLDVGSNIKLGTAGVVTATSFVGSGANLTGITQTTINNNADNRIITGSGTANTLNGEANLLFDGSSLSIGGKNTLSASSIVTYSADSSVRYQMSVSQTDGVSLISKNTAGSYNSYQIDGSAFKVRTTATNIGGMGERFRIASNGNVGVHASNPTARLHVDTSHYVATSSGRSTTGIHLDGTWGNAGEYGGGISFACGRDGSAAIAARQASSDGHRIGIAFFTHDSSTGSANAVEKVRIHDSGEASFNNGICLGNGLTLSTNHNLDDYEEGEYTANVRVTSGSATFTTTGTTGNKLFYVKIGKTCYISGGLSASSVSSAGGHLKFDLPFATANSAAGIAKGAIGSIWNYYGSSNPYGNYGWYTLHGEGLNGNVSSNITLAILGYNSQNSNWGPIGNLIGNNSQVHFSFTYRTN